MSLLDDIKSAAQTPGPLCAVLKVEADGNKHYQELAAAIRDHSLAASAIARVLKAPKYGLPSITSNTILRHRAGACGSCNKRGLVW